MSITRQETSAPPVLPVISKGGRYVHYLPMAEVGASYSPRTAALCGHAPRDKASSRRVRAGWWRVTSNGWRERYPICSRCSALHGGGKVSEWPKS